MARRKVNRRKPAPAKIHISLRDVVEVGFVIMMLTVFVSAIHWLRDPASLPIRHVYVDGKLEHVTPAQIRRISENPGFAGFFGTNLRDIEAALNALPWVSASSVKRKWPDSLIVNITEQIPVARWGSDALLNQNGEIYTPENLQAEGSPAIVDLPVVYGPLDQRKKLVERFNSINALLQPVGLSLRALAQDERRAWHLLLENGIPVALGREHPDSRINRFVRGFSQVITARAAQIAAIDLRYTNGFSVAWREDSYKIKNRGPGQKE